ncbi:MAG: hypothetical protein GF353_10810 [Candidatus Lokiarchaeota archaeon]|nr:hypothetical protein [Candidatus Lokiarchaeota archaeon]
MAVLNKITLFDTFKENRWAAEFFNPKYVFAPTKKYKWVRIGSILKKCQYGLSISMNEDNHGYPIFRMNEIDNCFLTVAKKYANISFKEFKEYKLEIDDVIFNRTNSFEFVGRTGILKEDTDSVFASYLVRINPDKQYILPEFLTIYLNTPFGIGQTKRRAMHSINQANVSAAELKRIFIPLIDIPTQEDIAELVNNSFNLKKESEKLYNQATELLEQELGLDKFNLNESLNYTSTFFDIINSHRIDAQHYKPKFAQLIHHLKNHFKCVRIGTIASYNQRGVQPIYVEDGDINVITSQHITNTHLKYDEFEKTSNDEFLTHPEANVKLGDILIYTTGAYIGTTNPYLSNEKALASNHVNILKIKENIDTTYLALVLNTTIGKLQTEKYQRGSAQAELYPNDIAKFIVPIIDEMKMEKIGNLVKESLTKLNEAKQLIQQAKSKVEKLIEQAAKHYE